MTEERGALSSFVSNTAAQVVGGLILAAVLGAILWATNDDGDGRSGGGTSDSQLRSESDSQLRSESDSQLRSEAVGRQISVDNFVVTVHSWECGAKEFTFYEAKGEFCVVNAKVENRGDSAIALLPTVTWRLYVGQLSFDSRAASGSGFDELFPGTSGEGKAAFDVPIGSDPTRLLLDIYSGLPEIPL